LIEYIEFLSPTDGWAFGGWVYINHWDGSNWHLVTSPIDNGWFNGTSVLSLTKGWVVGILGKNIKYGIFVLYKSTEEGLQ